MQFLMECFLINGTNQASMTHIPILCLEHTDDHHNMTRIMKNKSTNKMSGQKNEKCLDACWYE